MTERILYMEDDAAQARLVQWWLERADFAVDIAVDGNDGLAACASTAYDAVIVDQTMPGLSGLEVIRAMRLADRCRPPSWSPEPAMNELPWPP